MKINYHDFWIENEKKHLMVNCTRCDHNTVYSMPVNFEPKKSLGLGFYKNADHVEIF